MFEEFRQLATTAYMFADLFGAYESEKFKERTLLLEDGLLIRMLNDQDATVLVYKNERIVLQATKCRSAKPALNFLDHGDWMEALVHIPNLPLTSIFE